MPDKVKAAWVRDVPTWGWDLGFVCHYRRSVDIWVKMESGHHVKIWTYYRDELMSLPSQVSHLVGLTLDDARGAMFYPASDFHARRAQSAMFKRMEAEEEARRLEEYVRGYLPPLPPD